MRRRLHISDSLSFASDYVTKAVAILAQRRKGKTYTANKIAEQMCKAGIPWVALDPTGAWWGLRSSKDGKDEGFPVIVLGGDNGDIPLERTAGALVADLVVDNPGWYVLDLSHFESKAAEREFATAFAERFYRRKQKDKRPMHLFVDEADLFVPERHGGGEHTMVGAFETIVKRGGIRGIGVTLVCQRSASLNKNVLEQADIYIVLRTVGANDQKAIRNTLKAQAEGDELEELMATMASLKLGEAWVWEPGADPPLFVKVQVKERETFNSSATPEAGEDPIKPTHKADVDLDALTKAMAATIEKKKQDDPAELRKQIAQLSLELQRKPKEVPAPPPEPVKVEVFPERLKTGLLIQLRDAQGEVLAVAEKADKTIEQAIKRVEAQESGTVSTTPSRNVSTTAPKSAHSPADTPTVPEAQGDATLLKGERKMLAVLAGHHPMKLSRAQLGTLAGFKPSGGTFRNYFNTLKRNGLVIEHGSPKHSEIEVTQAGFDHLGENIPRVPETVDERIAFWGERMLAGERLMLDTLLQHPEGLTREDLGEITDFTATGGTFRNYLGTLKRNGLAEESDGVLKLGSALLL